MNAVKARCAATALTIGAMLALTPNAAAQLKIAVLNTGQAIQLSEEAKVYSENIQAELQPEQEQLRAVQAEIQAMQQRLADEGDVLADAERRDINTQIENKRLDLEFGLQKLQKAFADRQEELRQIMGPKVQAVLNDLIELERYDVVLERTTVLFANMRHDITAKVTEKLNERYAEGTATN